MAHRTFALVLIGAAALGVTPGAFAATTSYTTTVGTGSAAAPASSPQPGQSTPFSPGVPQSPAQAPTTTTTTPQIATTTTPGSSSGLSGGTAVAIGIGALVVLAAISLFIWRDARRRAPVRHGAAAATAGGGPRSGSKAKPKPRKLSPAERRRRKRGRAR